MMVRIKKVVISKALFPLQTKIKGEALNRLNVVFAYLFGVSSIFVNRHPILIIIFCLEEHIPEVFPFYHLILNKCFLFLQIFIRATAVIWALLRSQLRLYPPGCVVKSQPTAYSSTVYPAGYTIHQVHSRLFYSIAPKKVKDNNVRKQASLDWWLKEDRKKVFICAKPDAWKNEINMIRKLRRYAPHPCNAANLNTCYTCQPAW